MSSWEYKLISSGPLGFATMQLLEQHLSQLGKDEWEIISFTSKPENPLVFHGLARRPIARDWFPPAAVKPAYTPPPVPEEEDDGKDERSFADELPPSRPTNVPPPADLGLGDFDDLGGSEEDLPTLFEALQPFLRKNPRGDKSVELDFLAKKFEQDPRELLTAFEECGLKTPENGKGEVVDHDGSLYWLERDGKGRIWVNTRDKKFKTAHTTPVAAESLGEETPVAERPAEAPPRQERHQPAPERVAREPRPERPPQGRAPESAPADGGTFLGKIRSMMRRNRRGHGWSGSFQYLTKALKLDDAQLLEQVGEFGLRLEGGGKPVIAAEGNFEFWLNKNHRGEIWINADEKRENRGRGNELATPSSDPVENADAGEGASHEPAASESAIAPAPEGRRSHDYVDPRPDPRPVEAETESKPLPPENTLSAMRLLMQPKKRGEGVTAPVADLAEQLEKSNDQLMRALADAGLSLPDSPKAKPTFVEHGGELYWLNENAKGQVWINAKVVAPKKPRSKKGAE